MKRFASVFLPLAVTAVVLAATVASSTTLAGESTVGGAGITAVKIVRSSTGIGTDGNFPNFASWQNVKCGYVACRKKLARGMMSSLRSRNGGTRK